MIISGHDNPYSTICLLLDNHNEERIPGKNSPWRMTSGVKLIISQFEWLLCYFELEHPKLVASTRKIIHTGIGRYSLNPTCIDEITRALNNALNSPELLNKMQVICSETKPEITYQSIEYRRMLEALIDLFNYMTRHEQHTLWLDFDK